MKCNVTAQPGQNTFNSVKCKGYKAAQEEWDQQKSM